MEQEEKEEGRVMLTRKDACVGVSQGYEANIKILSLAVYLYLQYPFRTTYPCYYISVVH